MTLVVIFYCTFISFSPEAYLISNEFLKFSRNFRTFHSYAFYGFYVCSTISENKDGMIPRIFFFSWELYN